MTPPAPYTLLLGRLGFDLPKLIYGLKVSAAAFLSLCISWMLGLEHPQWAAITVFVTAQPTRGQVVEKAFYRFAGTILGSFVGAGIAYSFGGHLLMEMICLATWSAFMVWIGSLQRSFRSYGTVLAGYSAMIVLVLNPLDPAIVLSVALDRISTVFIGAAMGVFLAYLIAHRGQGKALHTKARLLMAEVLREAGKAQMRNAEPDMATFARLIAATAAIQDEIQTMSASGQTENIGPLEALLPALTNVLFSAYQHHPDEELGKKLLEMGVTLQSQTDYTGSGRALRRAIAQASNPIMEEALASLMAAVAQVTEDGAPLRLSHGQRRKRFALDWTGAWQGAVRIFLALSFIGLLWVVTNDKVFQYPIVCAAICMALASTGVTPTRKMVDVIKGQCLAAAIAIATEMLLWPIMSSPKMQLAAMLPAAFAFAFIRSHRKTTLAAPDYAIVVMLLLSPSYTSYEMTFHPIWKGVMAASGGILGYLFFLFIFPTDSRARRKALWLMIKRDLQELASVRRAGLSLEEWRLTFCQRFLKVSHWAALEGGVFEKQQVTMRKGMVTMRIAEVTFLLKSLEHRANLPSSLRRAIGVTLRRTATTTKDNDGFSRSFQLLAGRLKQAEMHEESALTAQLVADLHSLRKTRKS